MNIITEIKNLILGIDPYIPIYVNSWKKANEENLDDSKYPAVLIVRFELGRFSIKQAGIGEQHDIQIYFLAETQNDYDTAENDEIIQLRRDMAKDFLKAYNASSKFEKLTDDVNFFEVYEEKTDANITGVGIELTIKPTNYVC